MAAAPASPRDAVDDYGVDEVARLTGTSVRTIRWYQSEGLLAPPRRDGRVARYDAGHLARLETIRDLQAHGLTLTAIRGLFERAPDGAGARALAFVRAAVAPTTPGVDEVVPAAEGASRLGVAPTRLTAEQLARLGMIRELAGDRWQILVPAAFDAAAELAAHGVPLPDQLRVTEVVREHTEAMARRVVELFVDHLRRPSHTNGDPADPALRAARERAIDRLRPLATTSVMAFFDAALTRAAEAVTEELRGPGR